MSCLGVRAIGTHTRTAHSIPNVVGKFFAPTVSLVQYWDGDGFSDNPFPTLSFWFLERVKKSRFEWQFVMVEGEIKSCNFCLSTVKLWESTLCCLIHPFPARRLTDTTQFTGVRLWQRNWAEKTGNPSTGGFDLRRRYFFAIFSPKPYLQNRESRQVGSASGLTLERLIRNGWNTRLGGSKLRRKLRQLGW